MFVAAAGNESTSSTAYSYPAAYSNAMAVVNTDQYDQRRYTSNYGYLVDIAAPGVSIYSTARNGYYGYMTGTSMSSPPIAGLAELLASQGRAKYQICPR